MRASLRVVAAGVLALGAADAADASVPLVVRPVYSYVLDPCGVWVPVSAYPVYYYTPTWQPANRLPSPYTREYAPATPAPPSAEPIHSSPRPRQQPAVTEYQSMHGGTSGTYYDVYNLAGSAPAAGPDHAAVSFWNATDRRLTLRVDDRTYTLDRGQSVSLTAPRQFQWQVDGRAPQSTQAAAGQRGLQIVIRR